MKAQTMTAFGSTGVALQPGPVADGVNGGASAELRPGRSARASEPAAQDFALAMRRVEAECYDTL